MVSVQHLTKRFGRHVAVDDLTFEVKQGEVLGFLGPNGAGKTTTMRMITGYLPPSQGTVAIGGFDILAHPLEAKRRIGYLPELPPLYPEMTVRSYLAFVSEIKDIPAPRRAAQVDRAIGRAGLEEVRDKRISQLSKGFKQRVGLAQAIVHEPPLLILDEPTSSLDPKQRVEVRDLIARLRGNHTVILSTHILPEASQIADRVFIINRGRVMAVDTPANLAQRLRGGEAVTAEIQVPDDGAVDSRQLAVDSRHSTVVDTVAIVRDALGSLAGVTTVSVEEMGRGLVRARIGVATGLDLRGEVAALVTTRGWRLLGLGVETLSLEEIFFKLTDEGG